MREHHRVAARAPVWFLAFQSTRDSPCAGSPRASRLIPRDGCHVYREARRTQMRRLATIATYLFVVMALVIGVAAVPIGAADHLDGPMVMTDGLFDINDVYAFQSPAN